jgi:hypothetical protein
MYRRIGLGLTLALMLALLMAMAGCASRAAEAPVSGYAYVGPATLNLRKDLGPRAVTVATAKHGDRLEVIESRRRFVRVRTPEKIEGWTDSNLLLTEQQKGDLATLAKKAAEFPSQGTATVFDPLNMHTQPNRSSPSFYQIAAAAPLEVVEHRVTPHGGVAPVLKPVVVKRSTPTKKPKGKESKNAPLAPVPVPAPPGDWEALSRPRASDLPGYVSRAAALQSSGGDDWFLVRTRD